nr:hypothetical protein BaRGS_006950 [Batillaria attramentaria]
MIEDKINEKRSNSILSLCFTLKSDRGRLVVRIIDYGGIITEINVPDVKGQVADINLGFDDVAGYEADNQNLGALIGRVANNIAGGSFVMDGKTYNLFANKPPNTVHGGKEGFDKKLWDSRVDGDKLILRYISPNGEENFPGELPTTVTYRVTDADELYIEYRATTTKTTPVNFTNHAYFNLAGHDAGTLDDHVVTIHADSFLPIDKDGNPTGRYMECWTTEPGMQFYTSYYMQFMKGQGKGGAAYKPFGGYTLSSDSGRLLVRIITYGGIITEVHVPDRNGKMADINLGYDDVAGYETYDPYIGALIGRVANRVSGGKFVLDGVTYNLPINDIKGLQNQVHGGKSGFCRYEATTTKPTPVVLTNHAYFNLAGHDANTLDDHLVTIAADHYPALEELHPDRVEHPPTGRYCECWTTEPGIVFYTSSVLNVPTAKGGAAYTLSSSTGRLVVRILNYGGVITEILVPDRNGKTVDINLGYDDMAETLEQPCRGRQADFQYVSPDGEEGYPGELTTTVTYRVTDDEELYIKYEATTTKATPVVLTNHAYFNLAGHNAGTLDDHVVTIAADTYLPIRDDHIPTGEICSVDGTAWDLRKPVRLGNVCHKYHVAAVEHPPSGRCLECWTTEPGVIFYTSSFLNVSSAKGGAAYRKFGALCLEAQHYPDSVNQPSFPNTILRPENTYRQTTVYKFGVA